MGVGAVSQLQYDATMTAQSHVSVENSEHGHSGAPNPSDKSTVFDFHHIKHDGSTGAITCTHSQFTQKLPCMLQEVIFVLQ